MGRLHTKRNILCLASCVVCLIFVLYLPGTSKILATLSRQVLRHHLSFNSNTLQQVPQRYVVIALTVRKDIDLRYAFAVPLVAAAWNRINWKVVVIIVGDIDVWTKEPVYDLIRSTVSSLASDVNFINIPAKYNPVSYSQIVRLFSAILMPWLNRNDIIMTSDIDIFPLNGTFYNSQIGSGITIYNADCCGSFPWHGQNILMQPMTSIIMTVNDWRNVMDIKCLCQNSMVGYIDDWLMKHYGSKISRKDVIKGGNEEWYMDQRVISIQIHKSMLAKHKVRRNTLQERVDRIYMSTWTNFTYRTDAHLFLPSYPKEYWNHTMDLLRATFMTKVVTDLDTYRNKFVLLINKNKQM